MGEFVAGLWPVLDGIQPQYNETVASGIYYSCVSRSLRYSSLFTSLASERLRFGGGVGKRDTIPRRDTDREPARTKFILC